jgi:anthranilate phosphoribosyltransferase
MKSHLERILDGRPIDAATATTLFRDLTRDDADPAMAGAVLAALRCRGETPALLRGFAVAMRDLALRPALDATSAVDVVGTGGDGSGSLNLSTGASLLAAACGVPVVKHGNRSVSSRSGAADVLEALGYRIPEGPREADAAFRRHRFAFLFAPAFHPSMKRIATVRRALGVRTVFNLLGPLTNPARPGYAVVGAASPEAAATLAETAAGLGMRRAFVVHGAPGWDEATPVGPFLRFTVENGKVTRDTCDPRFHGVPRCTPESLLGGDAAYNADRLRAALSGEPGPHRDALALGAGLALHVSDRVRRLADGVETARRAIDDGRAVRLLDAVTDPSRRREASHG